MANNKMSGNLLGLKVNGTFISCEISCEFNFDADLRGASPVDAGRWKEWIPGVRSWNITLNAAMLIRMAGTGVNTILNAFLMGEKVDVVFGVRRTDIPSFSITGKAHIQNGSIAGGVNTLATWNTTLQGDGPFTAQINENIVYAISTVLDDTEILQDGNGDIVVGTNL